MGDDRYVVTISGPPGSGTSTLAEHLVNRRGYELLSGGDAFRALAAERGMTLQELITLAEEDSSVDRELDSWLEEEMITHLSGERDSNTKILVVESRLAGWFAPEEAFRVWIDAPLPVRASRIDDRDETVEELKERENSDAARYKQYYDIDVTSRQIYDLVLNTESIASDDVASAVLRALDAAFGEAA